MPSSSTTTSLQESREPSGSARLEYLRRKRPRSLRGGMIAGFFGGLFIGAFFCLCWCFVQLSGVPLICVPGMSVAWITGVAVREFSGGTDRRFGYLAAALAVLACLVLDIDLAWGIMMTQTGSSPRFSLLQALTLFLNHWEFSHLLGYALAAGVAYYFGFERPVAASARRGGASPARIQLALFVYCVLTGGLVLLSLSAQRCTRLSLSPDGRTLVASLGGGGESDKTTCWDLVSGQQVGSYNHYHPPRDQQQGPEFMLGVGHTGTLRCRVYSPDSRTVFTADTAASRVKGWDTRTGRQTHGLVFAMDWITTLAVSSDGQTLAVAGGSFHHPGEIHLLDVSTGRVRQVFTVPVNTVRTVVFTPDDRMLIAGTMASINTFSWPRNGGVHRWDIATGQELPPLQ